MCPKYLVLLGFLPFFTTTLVAQQTPVGQSSPLERLYIGRGQHSHREIRSGRIFADSPTQVFWPRWGPRSIFQLNYRIHSCFGLGLLVSGQENTVNTSAMEEQVEKANPGEFANFSSGQWQIGKIMAGPTYFHPIGKGRWELTVKGMAGALKTAQPQMTIAETQGYVISGGYVLSTSPSGISAFGESSSKRPVAWAFTCKLAGARACGFGSTTGGASWPISTIQLPG